MEPYVHAVTGRRRMRRLAVLASSLVAALAAAAGAGSGAATQSPLVGIVGSGKTARLAQLDLRTLAPRQSPRPLQVGAYGEARALSPDGRLAVLAGKAGVLTVDTRTLRVLRKSTTGDVGALRLWVVSPALFIVKTEGKLGVTYYTFERGGLASGLDTGFDAQAAVTPGGIAILNGSNDLTLLRHAHQTAPDISRLAANAPAAMAVDAAHDRLFVVSAAGLVAEVGNLHVANGETVSFHDASLPSDLFGQKSRFEVLWAGSGRLALVGPGGLSLLDTSNWRARTVEPGTTNAAASGRGVLAWNARVAGGIRLYGAAGKLRFRALAGHTVKAVSVVGPYAYVVADGRFSVDLRSGRVSGRLTGNARPLVPDLVDLP